VEANEVPRQPTLQPAAYLNIAENKQQHQQQQWQWQRRQCNACSSNGKGSSCAASRDQRCDALGEKSVLYAQYYCVPYSNTLKLYIWNGVAKLKRIVE